jgi:antitoxin component YwqK of YwqJK toxin-antitoxin module
VKDQNDNTMSDATVTWATSNSSIATVSSAGLVTSVADGTATITATSGSLSKTVAVTVSQENPDDEGEETDDGSFEERWPTGEIMVRGFTRDGRLDGRLERYRRDGTLESWQTMSNGVMEGPYETYYANGQLNEKAVRRGGSLNGPYEKYSENGDLQARGTLRNNDRCGQWTSEIENLPPYPSCSDQPSGAG